MRAQVWTATRSLPILYGFLFLPYLVGCPHPAPPPVFAEPVPVTEAPPELDITLRDNECPIVDIFEGEALSIIDDEGKATCYGHVIGTAKALELTHYKSEIDYWRSATERCATYRSEDRRYCQLTHDAKWQEAQALRRDGRIIRLATVGAFAAGVLIGGGIGVAALHAAP